MKTYEKPIISIDEGLAEGVYAASGTSVTVTSTGKNKWGTESGRSNYKIEFTDIKLTSITLTFNQPITGGSGNTQYSISGQSITFIYNGWNPPSPIDLSADVSTGLSTLELTGYTYTKA